MKRKSKYPPYHQARATAIDLALASANKYREWHKENKITYLPAYPERVYKDWVSWNDFLGNQNVFKGELKQEVRPYWDAVKWAQEFASIHDLDTIQDWSNYWKEHREELPSDIPLSPDSKYMEWVNWGVWLGTDIRSRLLTAKMNTGLLCICSRHSLSVPGNMFTIIQAEKGEVELRSTLTRDRELRVVRCYKMEGEIKDQIMETIKKHARHDSRGWFCENVNNLLFELDLLLVPFPITIKVQEVEPLDEELLFAYKYRV